MTRRRLALSALVGGLALLAAACGGGSSANSAKPTTSTPTSPPPTTATTLDPKATAEAAVLRDYRAFWDAYDKAVGATGLTPNPDEPALAAHATGEELTQVKVYVVGLRGKGYTTRAEAPTQFQARVVSITGNAAIVHDCQTDSTDIVDAKTGQLHSPPGAGKLGWEADLIVEGGTWKVSSLHRKQDLCAG